MADHSGCQFNSWRNISVNKVQRHFYVDFLVWINALEVSVQNQRFESVHLEVTQQYFFNFTINIHIENGRVEYFFQCMEQSIVIQCDVNSWLVTTVDDARCLTSIRQAAASLRSPDLYVQMQLLSF